MLESGFVEAAPYFLGVFDDVALVVGPLEVPGFGFHDKVLDLVIVLVSFLLESLDVNGDDNVEVREGTCHFSKFFENAVVIL